MFTVEGYLNGISYVVQVGVSPRRANDGVVAGSPQAIGMLKTREGIPMRARKGERAVTENTTTTNPAWVLACLHSETDVTGVDGTDIPDLGRRRTPRAPEAPAPAAAPPVEAAPAPTPTFSVPA